MNDLDERIEKDIRETFEPEVAVKVIEGIKLGLCNVEWDEERGETLWHMTPEQKADWFAGSG